MNLGEVAPRSPIMRRHMPTAKTTMLPATASQNTLAPTRLDDECRMLRSRKGGTNVRIPSVRTRMSQADVWLLSDAQ